MYINGDTFLGTSRAIFWLDYLNHRPFSHQRTVIRELAILRIIVLLEITGHIQLIKNSIRAMKNQKILSS